MHIILMSKTDAFSSNNSSFIFCIKKVVTRSSYFSNKSINCCNTVELEGFNSVHAGISKTGSGRGGGAESAPPLNSAPLHRN